MRFLILVVLLTACTATREPAQPPQNAASPTAPAADKVTTPSAAPTPRNFVCERFAAINDKATCTPESTDEGEHHLHRARVAIDGQLISCVINDTSASVVCDFLIAVQQQPPPPAPPAKGKQR